MEFYGDDIFFGTTTTDTDTHHPVTLDTRARLEHLFVIGQTGTGKTTLLKNLAIQDMAAGHGIAFLDPHGREARDLLDHVPRHRNGDVIYLNPADRTHAFGLNVLQSVPPCERDRLTQDLVDNFRSQWADSWGARMDYILKNTIRALLDAPDDARATLLSIRFMFDHPGYRERVLAHVENPAVLDFWQREFPSWSGHRRSEYLLPITNKVEQFLLSDTLRSILGQARSTIDLQRVLRDRKILIVDLDKGKLGESVTNLLGSLLVTALKNEAMRRDDHGATPPPFFCYLDEFHSFTTLSFSKALSEVRKYNVGFILAAQFLAQMDERVRASVFGNCANFCAFRIGGEDAPKVAQHIDRPAHSLVDLGLGRAAFKHTAGRTPVSLFMETSPLPENRRHTQRRRLIRQSNRFYATPMSRVDKRIARWLKRIM